MPKEVASKKPTCILCSPNKCSCNMNLDVIDSEFILQMNQDDYEAQEEEDEDEAFFKQVTSLNLDNKTKSAKIVKNYLIGDLLGDGSYGKVKECLDLDTLSRRAVKIINMKLINKKIPHGVANVRKEINIMQRLNHKNVIKLYDSYEKNLEEETKKDEEIKPVKLYIFIDYCMTSLEKLIKNAPDQRLHNWQAQHYFKQLIDGLEYLHSINIIHNDIKPSNLLITCDDALKICDFSISAELSVFHEYEFKQQQLHQQETLTNSRELLKSTRAQRFPIIQCTPMFQCPEMLEDILNEVLILKNANKIDVWSSGVTLYQMTTGKLPFNGQTIHQIYEKIRSTSKLNPIPEFVDQHLKELLLNMLNRDPVKRWSLQQIRDAEWFKKKHPILREELAILPQDVIQNELNSFRMINYLETMYQSSRANTLDSNDSYFERSGGAQLIEFLQNGKLI